MECKYLLASFLLLFYLYIKVEPYWNVNLVTGGTQNTGEIIKVEPYWNVNKVPDTCSLPLNELK